MKNIVAFDVETTGLDTSKDFVIQLSGVKFDKDFNIIDSYTTPHYNIGTYGISCMYPDEKSLNLLFKI